MLQTFSRETFFAPEIIARLRASLVGELLEPGQAAYEAARHIWNGHVDKYPALIVRCQTAQDVVQAVNFAHEHQLAVSVRGGGHNSAGLAIVEDGLVIDMSQMKHVAVDVQAHVAHVEPGLTMGELAAALEPYDLITPTGTCSGTGITGATLGGGIGWLTGQYGLAIDNVLTFELVTASGQLLRASKHQNSELFWGLRGGGGNFGVITAIEFQLHPLKQILGGMVIHPFANAREVLKFYYEYTALAPDELVVYCSIATLPQIGPVVVMTACYSGPDMWYGEEVLAPMREFGSPIMDTIQPMKYTDLLHMLDVTAPDGRNYYDTAYSLKVMSSEAIEAIIACAETRPSPFSAIVMHHIHGAGTRVSSTSTAFALREPHYSIVNAAAWEEGDGQACIHWAEEAVARMQPFASEGLYTNFMGIASEEELRASYRNNYERLVALKNQYDPTNFFNATHNIKPTA